MFSLTRFALKNTALFSVLLVIMTVLGIWTYMHFPSQEDPSFTIREAVVTTFYPGMSAERIEDLVTRPLEEKIREIPEVEFIRSSSKTDMSVIHVTVADRYFDLQPIWDELRNKVDSASATLPSGVKGPFVNDDYGDVTIATLALTSDGFTPAQMYDTAMDIRRGIYNLKGIKKVTFYGVQDETIYLNFSNAKLAEFGIPPQALVQSLRAANTLLPGGKMEVMDRTLVIEPSGHFSTLEEVSDLQLISPKTGKAIYLRDLVDVTREYVDPPKTYAFWEGKPAIMIAVSMSEGMNILELSDRLSAFMKSAESQLPVGYSLHFATFQGDWVSQSMASFTGNLYQTLAIVLAVVILFLGMRTGLIVGLNVPLTLLLTLIVMYAMHIPLHRVSIAALIISLGLLVDNGIVVAEDIKTRLQRGEPRDKACIHGGDSLMIPLLTSSLTTILAFLPLMLAEHRAGEYTYAISQVVSITLLGSWFLAITVVPLACFKFMRVEETGFEDQAMHESPRFYAGYRSALDWVLHHPKPFLLGMGLMLVLSIFMMRFVPKQFFPPSDRAQYTVYLDVARGASIKQTEKSVEKLTAWLLDKKENPVVTNTVGYVGEGGPRFFLSLSPFDPDPHRAFVLVDVKNLNDVDKMIKKTQRYVLENLPDTNADVKKLFLGPSETGVVQLRISGADPEKLYELAGLAKGVFAAIPGTVSIDDDWGNKTASVYVDIDEAQAGRNSITAMDVALSLNAFYSGYAITDFYEGDKVIPIVLRAEGTERGLMDNLRTVNVYSQITGKSVPLLQIAKFVPSWKFGHLKRRNFEHTITVSARNPGLYAGELRDEVLPSLAELSLPQGYHFAWGGEVEDSVKAQKALFAYLPLCLVLGFVLLVWQFNSVRRAGIVFLTLPLLMIGGVFGLVLMHATFGFVAMLGFMSLGGILVNNAIVLIDQADEELRAGESVQQAVINACMRRFRPILMTTLTTVLGLVPLILFGGDMWYGMACVIAFGLTVATVLTLGVVPVLYIWFMQPR